MRPVVGGLVGGAIGTAVWAAVVSFSGYEYGWIAWGIGGLVGFGVAAGNQDGSRSATSAGVLAVIIAAVSIVAGKYVGVTMMMPSDAELVAMFVEGFEDEEYVMSFLADEVVVEIEERGQTIDWPDVDMEVASTSEAYPADVWAEVANRWSAMSEAERADFADTNEAEVRANLEEGMPQIRAMIAGGGFFGSFSPMDLIFFGLAMTTAWGLGSGGKKTEEEIAAEYAEAVQLAMLTVMVADGDVDEDEVRIVSSVHEELTGVPVSHEVIRAKATLASSTDRDLYASLTELAPHLNEDGRARVLQAGVRVAIADGHFDASEQAVLAKIGQALGMSEDDMRKTVSALTQAAGPAFV